jgi:hypothetical protein
MNWNRAGRILLFVNVALSLTFAYWGIGLYMNHVDWSNQKSGENLGESAKREAEIKRWTDEALARNAARLELARRDVRDAEERRPQLLAWYQERLESLRTGADKQPVLGLVYDKGELKFDNKGYPLLGPVRNLAGQPVPGLENLQAQATASNERQAQIRQVTQEIDKLAEEQRKLTEEIGDGRDKGLRAELAAVQQDGQRAQAEQEFLRPLLYNRLVEIQILAKRQKALEARLKELEGARVARVP